ncbi:hypothetical protein EON63_21180 [archaeon]|nr:MAG: hypothetical protein EON63_21180 [archaeon]
MHAVQYTPSHIMYHTPSTFHLTPYTPNTIHITFCAPYTGSGVFPNDMPSEKDFYTSNGGFDIGPGGVSCLCMYMCLFGTLLLCMNGLHTHSYIRTHTHI